MFLHLSGLSDAGVVNLAGDLIYLAGRRVRTPEGSKKFGLPIGALITRDAVIRADKKFPGMKVPEDAGRRSGGSGVVSAPKAPRTPQAKKTATQITNVIKKSPDMDRNKAKFSTLKGDHKTVVGTHTYNLPAGSRVYRTKGDRPVAIARTPDEKLHILTPKGRSLEINDPDTENALNERLDDMDANDPDFDMEVLGREPGLNTLIDGMDSNGPISSGRDSKNRDVPSVDASVEEIAGRLDKMADDSKDEKQSKEYRDMAAQLRAERIAAVPDANKPDANKPDANKPDANKPDANKPEAAPRRAAAEDGTARPQRAMPNRRRRTRPTTSERDTSPDPASMDDAELRDSLADLKSADELLPDNKNVKDRLQALQHESDRRQRNKDGDLTDAPDRPAPRRAVENTNNDDKASKPGDATSDKWVDEAPAGSAARDGSGLAGTKNDDGSYRTPIGDVPGSFFKPSDIDNDEAVVARSAPDPDGKPLGSTVQITSAKDLKDVKHGDAIVLDDGETSIERMSDGSFEADVEGLKVPMSEGDVGHYAENGDNDAWFVPNQDLVGTPSKENWSDGDRLERLDDLKDQKPGTEITLDRQDGGKEVYTVMPDGSVMNNNDRTMIPGDIMKTSIHSGHVSVSKVHKDGDPLPEVPSKEINDVGDYVEGDHIAQYKHLTDMKPGQQITIYVKSSKNGGKALPVVLTRTDDTRDNAGFMFLVGRRGAGYNSFGENNASIFEAINDKRVFFGDITNLPGTKRAEMLDTDWDDTPNIPLWEGGPEVSQKELWDFINAQVYSRAMQSAYYNVDLLPLNSIFRSKDVRDRLSADALEKYNVMGADGKILIPARHKPSMIRYAAEKLGFDYAEPGNAVIPEDVDLADFKKRVVIGRYVNGKTPNAERAEMGPEQLEVSLADIKTARAIVSNMLTSNQEAALARQLGLDPKDSTPDKILKRVMAMRGSPMQDMNIALGIAAYYNMKRDKDGKWQNNITAARQYDKTRNKKLFLQMLQEQAEGRPPGYYGIPEDENYQRKDKKGNPIGSAFRNYSRLDRPAINSDNDPSANARWDTPQASKPSARTAPPDLPSASPGPDRTATPDAPDRAPTADVTPDGTPDAATWERQLLEGRTPDNLTEGDVLDDNTADWERQMLDGGGTDGSMDYQSPDDWTSGGRGDTPVGGDRTPEAATPEAATPEAATPEAATPEVGGWERHTTGDILNAPDLKEAPNGARVIYTTRFNAKRTYVKKDDGWHLETSYGDDRIIDIESWANGKFELASQEDNVNGAEVKAPSVPRNVSGMNEHVTLSDALAARLADDDKNYRAEVPAPDPDKWVRLAGHDGFNLNDIQIGDVVYLRERVSEGWAAEFPSIVEEPPMEIELRAVRGPDGVLYEGKDGVLYAPRVLGEYWYFDGQIVHAPDANRVEWSRPPDQKFDVPVPNDKVKGLHYGDRVTASQLREIPDGTQVSNGYSRYTKKGDSLLSPYGDTYKISDVTRKKWTFASFPTERSMKDDLARIREQNAKGVAQLAIDRANARVGLLRVHAEDRKEKKALVAQQAREAALSKHFDNFKDPSVPMTDRIQSAHVVLENVSSLGRASGTTPSAADRSDSAFTAQFEHFDGGGGVMDAPSAGLWNFMLARMDRFEVKQLTHDDKNGALSDVYLVKDKTTGQNLVVKTQPALMHGMNSEALYQEVVALELVNQLGIPGAKGRLGFANGAAHQVGDALIMENFADAVGVPGAPVKPMRYVGPNRESIGALMKAGPDPDAYLRIGMLDYLIGNEADRHQNNMIGVALPDGGARLAFLDFGLAFDGAHYRNNAHRSFAQYFENSRLNAGWYNKEFPKIYGSKVKMREAVERELKTLLGTDVADMRKRLRAMGISDEIISKKVGFIEVRLERMKATGFLDDVMAILETDMKK